jgi:Zn-finger nucleic acid-binding protein
MNELPKTMKGVWLTGHGELDKLDVRSDIPVPKDSYYLPGDTATDSLELAKHYLNHYNASHFFDIIFRLWF